MVALVNKAAQVRQTSFLPLKENMNPILALVLRHLFTAIGGAIVAKYGLDGVNVESVAGSAVAGIGVAWSVWEKRGR